MNALFNRIQTLVEWAIGALLVLMVVLVFTNAAGRYLFGTGIASSEEIARLAFVWLIFLGAVLAVRERTHVGVDMLVQRLPRGLQKLCLVVCNLLILYALWLFAQGSWQQVIVGFNSRMPVTNISLASFAAAGLVASVAMAVLFVVDLIRLFMGRMSDAELVQVRETADAEEIREFEREFAPASNPPHSGKPS
ncbi:TRAP transporter small permease [Ancylobacter sp. Lp-2]|uniref:TRAP transporter small permease n=1 Tax=Ancylobacter sp. Lp-2 TaxID=2881339 RepID=UPI001E638BAB|nr:TRAP transporter small permease [Ancylobacter sp. Lp-2]MCB4769753.1 TRAP transporter small permease [Ancylobacter sp. Lp-2]